MSNNGKALRSGVWYTFSSFLVKAIGFLTTPLFTRLLTKNEFGLFSNFSSWVSIFGIFITLNLESTLISARYDYEENFDKYILSMFALSSLSACIWAVILNVFSDIVVNLTGISHYHINIMLVYLLFLPAVNLFQARERFFFEYKKSVVTSVILSVGTAFLSVLLVILLDNKLDGRIYGFVIPTIVIGFFFCLYFIRKGSSISFKYWQYAIPICLPYIPHLLAGVLLNNMDRIMINKWCGAEATAMYSLAYSCGAIVTLLVNAINSAYAPWLGEKLSEGKNNEIRQVSKNYILCFCMFALGIMLISPEILYILGGNGYQESRYVITPVAMGCVCQFLYTMFGNVEQFKKKTLGMAIATVIAAFINYVLNFLLIPQYGYLAAAYTTLIGYLCLLFIHMYIVWKLGYSNIYNYKFVLSMVMLGLAVSSLITFSFNHFVLRLIMIFVYIVTMSILIFNNKEKILTVIRKKRNK